MPLLSLEQLEALQRTPPRYCTLCRHPVRSNYCRECDEYFEAGHMPVPGPCVTHAKHDAHRTY